MATKSSPEYKTLKKAFQTPGMQPGERKAVKAIMDKRGVSRSEAKAIGKRRTAKGLSTAGVAGPGGTPRYTAAQRAKNPVKQKKGGAPKVTGRTGNTGPFPGKQPS